MMKLVRMLTDLGERQGATAIQAAARITVTLDTAGIAYVVEQINTELPEASSTLSVDGVLVDSAPTSLIGGRIDGKDALVSSLIPTRYLIDVPNINFNPQSTALSRPNFYFAPSLAIRSGDVQKVLNGKEVEGEVLVERKPYQLPQILVGNRTDPKNIIFSHFDSIGPGAIDNASGTAVCLALILGNPELLDTALFVFDPNEELSYDYPTYWGHGYRVFEERYGTQLAGAERILVVDCVGNGVPQVISDPHILNLAFPIIGLAELLSKTVTIGGDIDGMMEVYQGDTDTPELLSEIYMEETRMLLMKLLSPAS